MKLLIAVTTCNDVKNITLFSTKTRALLTAVFAVFIAAELVMLPTFQALPVKIILLHAFTACVICLIIIRKNCLNIYELGIFCFLCAGLLTLAPNPGETYSFTAATYLLSYRYGVSSRSFAATIVDFLCGGGAVSKYFVWHFIFCSTVLLLFLLSCFISVVIQKTKQETRHFVLFITLLYLTYFTSPFAYFVSANFGRVEIFAFAFMLVMLAVLERPLLRWIVPVLALFTMAAHIILVFFYVPFIAVMLLHTILTKNDRKKSAIILFAVTAGVVIIAFLLYFLFHKKTFVFTDARAFAGYLQNKSDIDFTEWDLHMTLFAKLRDHLDNWKNRVKQPMYLGNISVLVNIPCLTAFIVFWVKCFRRETKKAMKFFFALPVLLLVCHAAVFFMFYDFGRWMIMIMNIQFMLLFYLINAGNNTVLSFTESIAAAIKKRWFLFALVCALMLFIGPVKDIGPSDRLLRLTFIMLKLIGAP